jgi:hypothetical protein
VIEKKSIDISLEIFKKLDKIKRDSGFAEKKWDEWLDDIFDEQYDEKKTMEKIFEKSAYEKYYDDWIHNFALNLENIWNGKSAKELTPNVEEKQIPGIVIGRGPSIVKYSHLEQLANSNFDGAIICVDSALRNVLRSGITPDKFKNFFVITIDTQISVKEMYSDPIIKQFGNKIKCLLSTTVPLSTYDIVKDSGMKIYWLHTLFDYNKGQSSFNYISGKMSRSKHHINGIPGIQTGGNVGTSAWVTSWSILKCNPVGLIGIDLGYDINTSWKEIFDYHNLPYDLKEDSEIFEKAFPTIFNPDFNCHCRLDPKFQFYSNALKEFIPKAAKYVKTINATEGGSIFGKGIECMKFSEFLKKFS